MYNWLHFHTLLVFALGFVRATDRPNIVFLVADDLGWNDVGFTGSPDVRTPNLDALAGHSVTLKRHYGQTCCSPSRAALLTGRYPIRSGMQGKPLPAGSNVSLPLTEKLFPEYFRELGYRTHLVGKWHLGYHTKHHIPTNRGFDTFYGFLNGLLGYYDGTHTQSGISGRDLRRNETGVALEAYGRYLTDVLSEEAVSIIENHPHYGGLLLFLMFSAPHAGNLGFMREAPPGVPSNATYREVYKEMVGRLDQSVGNVVKALNKNGLLNNTILVFLSDNGAPTEDQLFGFPNHGSNYPLRGEKLSNREGGVRTPSFVWSPLLRNNARVSNQLFHITDWFPTLYTAAGGNLSALSSSVTLDGIDQWASLVSSEPSPRHELLVDINDIYQTESYILKKWKLVKDPPPDIESAYTIRYYGEIVTDMPYNDTDVAQSTVGKLLPAPKIPYSMVRKETALKGRCNDTEAALKEDCSIKYCLYNLQEDPSECRNLADSNPGMVSLLVSRLEGYKKVMVHTKEAVMDPRSNPEYWDDYWSPWMDEPPAANYGPRHTLSCSVFHAALFFWLVICVYNINIFYH